MILVIPLSLEEYFSVMATSEFSVLITLVINDSEKDDYQQTRSELQKIKSDELILALVNNYRNKNNIQINLDLLKN